MGGRPLLLLLRRRRRPGLGRRPAVGLGAPPPRKVKRSHPPHLPRRWSTFSVRPPPPPPPPGAQQVPPPPPTVTGWRGRQANHFKAAPLLLQPRPHPPLEPPPSPPPPALPATTHIPSNPPPHTSPRAGTAAAHAACCAPRVQRSTGRFAPAGSLQAEDRQR